MLLEIRQAMPPRLIAKLIAGAVIVFILIIAASSSTYVVEPGHRGVQVTLGKVSPVFKPEGFGLKMPFVTAVISQPIRQQTATVDEECYSSDLQQITIGLKVLYRIPEASVVALFRDYEGMPFETLIKPRSFNERISSTTLWVRAKLSSTVSKPRPFISSMIPRPVPCR